LTYRGKVDKIHVLLRLLDFSGGSVRVLSGIQPSGKLHIGNYFGAMRQNLALQAEHEGLYFIADYHALTNSPNPADIRQWTLDVAMDYLALGLDPKKTIFWRQSDVPEVCELTWFFACVTPKALLERCTTYKDKVAQGLSPNHGLFTYPVLQAADILIFKSNLVPVGADQKQHLEITRDIAQFFNNIYGEIFPMPKEHILESVAIVPGIDGRKMSKSYGNAIEIFESESSVKKKIMSIVTDSTPIDAAKDPDICNVFAMLKLFACQEEIKEWEQKYRKGGTGYGHTKKRLVELMHEFFRPYRPKRRELEENPDQVEKILLEGAARARTIARQTIDEVRQAVGLRAMGR
jgi:tryptophanyl-tRNA synthetase